MAELSVLMTVYNGMPYIEQAVESILNQTFADFKFVIVDDGSNDQTPQFLAALDDPRVQIITQTNQGTAAAANHGLQYVDTPFVARMDADDIAIKDRLEKQLAHMKAHPEVGILGGQVAPVGDYGHGKSLNLPTTHEEIFNGMMSGRHGLAHSSIMIRTDTLKQLGGYWKHRLIDDWDMMLRMGEVSQLANLDEITLLYRVHSGSLNGKSMWRMHRHIGYAIECAKRRQSEKPPISFNEFEEQMRRQPLLKRIAEAMHVHAMANYRVAIADIHGNRKILGYLRLVYAAICSPARTLHRIGRMAKRLAGGSNNSSRASAPT